MAERCGADTCTRRTLEYQSSEGASIADKFFDAAYGTNKLEVREEALDIGRGFRKVSDAAKRLLAQMDESSLCDGCPHLLRYE